MNENITATVTHCPKCHRFMSLKSGVCKCGHHINVPAWVNKEKRFTVSTNKVGQDVICDETEVLINLGKFPKALKFFKQMAESKGMKLSDVVTSYAIIGTSVDIDKLKNLTKEKKWEKALDEIPSFKAPSWGKILD